MFYVSIIGFMSVDTQTVTLGTSTTLVGYSSNSPTFGSISDGTCNFKSGAAYEQLSWVALRY